MATIQESTIQQTAYESRNWTADFTNDLPTGGTVSGGTAYHTPPAGGSTLTPTITVSTPYVSALLANPADVGIHYVRIVGTFSNGEESEVAIAFPVGYSDTQARQGMADIIRRLRGLAQAGAVDYQVAGIPFWSDAQLQEVLDDNRVDFIEQELRPIPKTVSSTYVYTRYDAPYGNLETYASGSAIFTLITSDGTQAGTANYSVDYTKGIVTFTADQGGTAWFLSGRSYDLNAAAAEVWEQKAGYYQMSFDVKTDGHDLKRSQLFEQAMNRADFYRSKAGASTIDILRGDEL